MPNSMTSPTSRDAGAPMDRKACWSFNRVTANPSAATAFPSRKTRSGRGRSWSDEDVAHAHAADGLARFGAGENLGPHPQDGTERLADGHRSLAEHEAAGIESRKRPLIGAVVVEEYRAAADDQGCLAVGGDQRRQLCDDPVEKRRTARRQQQGSVSTDTGAHMGEGVGREGQQLVDDGEAFCHRRLCRGPLVSADAREPKLRIAMHPIGKDHGR